MMINGAKGVAKDTGEFVIVFLSRQNVFSVVNLDTQPEIIRWVNHYALIVEKVFTFMRIVRRWRLMSREMLGKAIEDNP